MDRCVILYAVVYELSLCPGVCPMNSPEGTGDSEPCRKYESPQEPHAPEWLGVVTLWCDV